MLNAGISMGDTVGDLILIWEAGEVDEFANQIIYLPL
jgi:hypothetical protein